MMNGLRRRSAPVDERSVGEAMALGRLGKGKLVRSRTMVALPLVHCIIGESQWFAERFGGPKPLTINY
jgi:hypothetical protein